MEKIPVFIVDDQNLFRQSLALLINTIKQFELLGDFDSGHSILEKLPYIIQDKPYIALVDMGMPDMNGVELNKILQDKYPQIKVIILSVDINPLLISQMIEARASAYLAKNCDKDELITAIQAVYKTGFYFDHQVLKALQKATSLKAMAVRRMEKMPVSLTEREKQIIQLICLEHNNAEIAGELFLSQRTVEGLKVSLLAKTAARNSAGLVLFAIKYGLFIVKI
jgi:DNA-binding NarL/FixJ family response regulator